MVDDRPTSLPHVLNIGPPKPNLGLDLEWLGSRVVSVLDSGEDGPGFKSQPRRCGVTVLGKLHVHTHRVLVHQA